MKIQLLPAPVRSVAVLASLALATPASAQVLRAKIMPPEPVSQTLFSRSLDWLPGEVFVAVAGDDAVVPDSGAVYVYGEVGDDWVLSQVLKTPVPKTATGLGWTLEASGDWLVTTAPFAIVGGEGGQGEAEVWRRVAGSWTHHQTLVASDVAQPGTQLLGTSADIDGSTLVLGCFADNSAGTGGAGSAYVFELQGSTWVETQKLVPAGRDLEFDALFGRSVAVRGDTLVVGASNIDNGTPGSDRGAAFVFERSGGAWTQVQKLVADDPQGGDQLGTSLALQGDTLLVGAREHDHDGSGQRGAVYVFTRIGGLWTQTQEIRAPAPGDPYLFGTGLDLDLNVAVIGSSGDDDLGTQSGSACVYRRTDAQWELFGKALVPDGAAMDYTGQYARIRGTRILLSGEGDDGQWGGSTLFDSGAAYVFDIAPRTWQYGSCFALGPCGNGDDHGGCANSDGQGAVLAAGGSTSVSEDALALEARWLPPDVLGILFLGGGEQAVPFGDGRLVVGAGSAGVFRFLPPQSSGAEGAMLWDGGLVAQSQANPPAGQIVAGSTWYAQVWYRDPSGPCGSGYNTTNGLKIDFKP